MNKPYYILHMITSLDGKITGNFLSSEEGSALCEEYYRINREYKADGYLCGRITMQQSFAGDNEPDISSYKNTVENHEDYIAKSHPYYAVAIDPHGRLNWQDSEIHDYDSGYDNAHIVEVLTKDIPKGYTNFLKSKGISYIFCGEKQIDAHLLGKKLLTLFGIKKLLIEGGGYTDTLFAKEDLIDELSIVVAPIIENDANAIDLFAKKGEDFKICKYGKVSVNNLPYSGLWIKYTK